MRLYDKTSYWPESSLEILARTIPNYKKIFILGQSINFKYSSKYLFDDDETVVISYNYVHRVFVAYCARIHNHIHEQGIKLTLSAKYTRNYVRDNEAKSVYQYRNKYGYEKIAFIGENALYEFCNNFDYYLTPNPSDVNFRSPAIYVDDSDELNQMNDENDDVSTFIERKRDRVLRLRRDPSFRKRILEIYGNRCIICGCSEVKILEAAHIVDVQYDNDDSDDNGLCLCCNHHKLYDSGLLSINWDDQTFECSSEFERNMSWYREAEERGFRLILNE